MNYQNQKVDYETGSELSRRELLEKALNAAGLIIVGGLAGLVDGCATAPKIQLVEGTPNTLTFINKKGEKETVYRIEGDWIYYSSSPKVVLKDGAIVKIVQKGNQVEGYWKENSGACKEGSIWFEGKIKGDNVSGFRYPCIGIAERQILYIQILEDGREISINIMDFDGNPTTVKLKKIS
jgi:hypothetical protein